VYENKEKTEKNLHAKETKMRIKPNPKICQILLLLIKQDGDNNNEMKKIQCLPGQKKKGREKSSLSLIHDNPDIQ